ncbi:MAG TPA: glycoside hydrolase family 30 beta sandwich domain-containing protein [Pyrinomonadaceae bacterium]
MRSFVSRFLIVAITLGFYAGTSQAANVSVNVDYTNQRQTVEGFGASATWVANDLDAFSPAKQTQILELLYDTSKPSAGLSWVRVGSFLCDYNPSPGVFDWNHWGIQSGMRWLQRVNASYGVNKYIVSTWSPPGWMKDNNSCINGGHVRSQFYPNLAALKIQWLQNAKAQLGFEAQVESVQNEPDHRAGYDSCEWTSAELNTFVVNHLRPALNASGLISKLMAPEVSFYSNFDNAWGFPLLNDAGMRAAVNIVATHGYGRTDNFANVCNSCAQHNKPIWQTEDSNLDGRYNGSIDDGLTWSTEIFKSLNSGRFSAWFYWWVMTLQNDNQGLLNVNPATDSVQIPKRLYVVGQFSRFIRPGSVMLGSTSSEATLQVTAVRPTSGNVTIVLANTGKTSHTVTVNLTGTTPPASVTPHRTSAGENQAQLSPINVSAGAFTITVPAKSVVTVVG